MNGPGFLPGRSPLLREKIDEGISCSLTVQELWLRVYSSCFGSIEGVGSTEMLLLRKKTSKEGTRQ
jgi:hypothetical protein